MVNIDWKYWNQSVVLVYGKQNCEWCDKLKYFLDFHAIPYRYVDVMKDSFDVKAFVENTGMKTVPVIYVNGKLIGGYHAFMEWYKGE